MRVCKSRYYLYNFVGPENDKMMNHFIELGHRYMVYRDNSTGLISLTSKGKKFVKQYDELINLIESAGL